MAENTSIERVNIASTLANKRLNTYVGQIARAALNVQTQTLKVAFIVAQIQQDELWKDDFESFEAFGLAILGKKKATLYNLVKVGKSWVDKNGHTIFYDGECDYTASQLYQIMRLRVDKKSETTAVDLAKEMHASGQINYLMSCEELREIVEAWNSQFKKAKSEEANGKEGKGKKGKAKVKAEDVFTVESALEVMKNEKGEIILAFGGDSYVLDKLYKDSIISVMADIFETFKKHKA